MGQSKLAVKQSQKKVKKEKQKRPFGGFFDPCWHFFKKNYGPMRQLQNIQKWDTWSICGFMCHCSGEIPESAKINEEDASGGQGWEFDDEGGDDESSSGVRQNLNALQAFVD